MGEGVVVLPLVMVQVHLLAVVVRDAERVLLLGEGMGLLEMVQVRVRLLDVVVRDAERAMQMEAGVREWVQGQESVVVLAVRVQESVVVLLVIVLLLAIVNQARVGLPLVKAREWLLLVGL